MAIQENCTRVTRLTKKRAAERMTAEQQQMKKRVALGEIKDFQNVGPNHIQNLESKPHNPKPNQAKRKAKKAVTKIVKEDRGTNEVEEGIDSKSGDPQLCSAYVSDIYGYLRQMEGQEKRRPLHDYLEKVQNDVTANMRRILVDCLVEVAEEYKLHSDTLYLTVDYIDRFLKYDEISPPHVEDFCYITDNTYTKDEVVKMEDVLKSLKFELGNPTIKTFLKRFTQIAQEDYKKHQI